MPGVLNKPTTAYRIHFLITDYNYTLQTTDYKLQITVYRLQITVYRLLSRLQMEIRFTGYQLPLQNSFKLIKSHTHYQRLTVVLPNFFLKKEQNAKMKKANDKTVASVFARLLFLLFLRING